MTTSNKVPGILGEIIELESTLYKFDVGRVLCSFSLNLFPLRFSRNRLFCCKRGSLGPTDYETKTSSDVEENEK